MAAYILRRLLLVIPTLFGIMLVNFALTQFVPGGPFDQIEARLEGNGDSIQAVTGGGGDDPGAQGGDAGYVGARGLPPEFRAQLEVEFGFARFVCPEGYQGKLEQKAKDCEKQMIPAGERFAIMMGKFLRFDFGQSYFRSAGVMAVSYTHLDVYKRQEKFQSVEVLDPYRIKFTFTPGISFRDMPATAGGLSVLSRADFEKNKHDLEAVSYTHLDVYKRQVIICAARRSWSG